MRSSASLVATMPITQQAKKAIRRDQRRRVSTLRRKRSMKAIMKEVRELAAAGKAKDASEKLTVAYKAIDKAAKRGVIKKNNAARKKSRLARLLARSN